MNRSGTMTIITGLLLLALAVFTVLFFYGYNRYDVLCYHEQMQLFRFDGLYFLSYIGQPGGLTKYAGAFLTQFYYNPLTGSMLIAGITVAVFLLFSAILKASGAIFKVCFLPFIPAILLMTAFIGIYFDLAMACGLLLALIGFRIYIALGKGYRYFMGPTMFTALYFVAAGNALLFSALIILHELFEGKNGLRLLFLTVPIGWSILLPWIAWQTIYVVPDKEAFFALTPLNDPFNIVIHNMLWLSIPVLYVFWRLIAYRVTRWNFATWKILVPNVLLTIGATTFGIYKVYDGKVETLYGMIFEAQHRNWEQVISLSQSYPATNRLVSYYTNMALAQSGMMADSMFHYPQTGVSGLFLDRDLSYFSVWYTGEAYYNLGMMLAAEHGAMEAMIGSPKEPNVQTLQRLVYTNILRRDSTTAAKYIRFFEHSLYYRQWADTQREHLQSAMTDSTFTIPQQPTPVRSSDFFINYQYPDQTMLQLLNDNPKHRPAFDYLMAYYMLLKDLERMKVCLDTFFDRSNGFPVHYEEALIVYQNLTQASDKFYVQYPVSQATRDHYTEYIQAYQDAQGNKHKIDLLQKQFGHTYWFYLHFVEPATLQKNEEKNRY